MATILHLNVKYCSSISTSPFEFPLKAKPAVLHTLLQCATWDFRIKGADISITRDKVHDKRFLKFQEDAGEKERVRQQSVLASAAEVPVTSEAMNCINLKLMWVC